MERNTGWKRIVYLMCAIQVGAVSYTHLTLPTKA